MTKYIIEHCWPYRNTEGMVDWSEQGLSSWKRQTFQTMSPVQRDTKSGTQSSKVINSLVTPIGGYNVSGEIRGRTLGGHMRFGDTYVQGCVGPNQPSSRGPAGTMNSKRQLVSVDAHPPKIYGHAPATIFIGETVYSVDIVVKSPLTSEAILA